MKLSDYSKFEPFLELYKKMGIKDSEIVNLGTVTKMGEVKELSLEEEDWKTVDVSRLEKDHNSFERDLERD